MIRRRFPILHRVFSTRPLQNNQRNPTLFRHNKTISELGKLGRVNEARQLFDSMPHRDEVSYNTIISAYTKSGQLDEAKTLFDSFEGKNVRTWTIMFSGYAKSGRIDEARDVFDAMPERNVVSWNALVNGYMQNGDLRKARLVFDEMPERNVSTWNGFITGYCRWGMMKEANEVFSMMNERNSVSWLVMVSGYVEINKYREAWWMFLTMMRSGGVLLDQALFVVAFSAVSGLNSLGLVESLKTIAVKTGFVTDVAVGTAILNAYTRNGSLDNAYRFFQAMPEKNEYSFTTMIAAFSQCDRLDDAITIYENVHRKTISVQNAMITAYAQKGRIEDAKRIFNEVRNPNVITYNAMLAGSAQNGKLDLAKNFFLRMPERNAISWSAMISRFLQNGFINEGLGCFSLLHRTGMVPSDSSFTSAFYACANVGDIEIGRQIHSLSIKARCQNNSFVTNALISMYGKCKNMEDVLRVFGTTREKDNLSPNSMILAYVLAGQEEDALKFFLGMSVSGIQPTGPMIISLLIACGNLGASLLGEQFHTLIVKYGFESRLIVSNALITMYFKCGSLVGLRIFESMPEQDIVSWNAVLAGCAQNGLGFQAVDFFEQMKTENVLPDEVSFLAVLCACSYSGLINEGKTYLNSMIQDYKIKPMVHHYTCIVDLLGRAGKFSEAEALIQTMPVKSDDIIWDALLSACLIHRNIELTQRVAERIIELGTRRYGTYVLLSNIYESQGMLNKVKEIEDTMKRRDVTEELGSSWMYIDNKLHTFFSGDKTHEVCLVVQGLYARFKASDYYCMDTTNFAHYDMEGECKKRGLIYHSEKLAIAYAILHTPNDRKPIRIMKNLRICGDCHSFMKFTSEVTQRRIIVRGRKRFHHFKNGLCSCGDY